MPHPRPPPDDPPHEPPFACYAVLVAENRFAYLHGPAGACARLLLPWQTHEYLLRQRHDTSEQACAGCEAAAAAVHGSRGGLVVASAVRVDEFRALCRAWGREA